MSAKDTLVLAIGTGGGNVVADILRQRKERISSSRDIEFVFADTNDEAFPDYEEEFDLAEGSFFTIGPNLLGGEGAGFDHEAAMAAFEESRDELIALVSRYKAVIIVAAGGKTTGLHSMFPLSEAAWTSGTFVMPLFIKPCMDPGHECDAAQLALFEAEVEKFDQTGIRLGVILNEAAYRGARRKMSRAYRDINTPLVEGIEGVATFLASPKDVDRKDMMRQIVRGPGRYFIGSCAVPSNAEREKLVQVARAACENRFFEFRNDGVPGGALALNIGDADNFEEAALRSGAFAYFNELAEERKKAPPRIIPGSFRDLPEGSPKLFTILAGEPLPDGMQPPELPKFRWATERRTLRGGSKPKTAREERQRKTAAQKPQREAAAATEEFVPRVVPQKIVVPPEQVEPPPAEPKERQEEEGLLDRIGALFGVGQRQSPVTVSAGATGVAEPLAVRKMAANRDETGPALFRKGSIDIEGVKDPELYADDRGVVDRWMKEKYNLHRPQVELDALVKQAEAAINMCQSNARLKSRLGGEIRVKRLFSTLPGERVASIHREEAG